MNDLLHYKDLDLASMCGFAVEVCLFIKYVHLLKKYMQPEILAFYAVYLLATIVCVDYHRPLGRRMNITMATFVK